VQQAAGQREEVGSGIRKHFKKITRPRVCADSLFLRVCGITDLEVIEMILYNKYFEFRLGFLITPVSCEVCLGWIGFLWLWKKVKGTNEEAEKLRSGK
jgi:hypothetical protein